MNEDHRDKLHQAQQAIADAARCLDAASIHIRAVLDEGGEQMAGATQRAMRRHQVPGEDENGAG